MERERRTKIAQDGRRRVAQGGYYTRNWMRDRKNKTIKESEDFDLGLSFTIGSGHGIDPPSAASEQRTYFLVWWLEPGRENWAPYPAKGNAPAWDRIWKYQRFDKDVWPGFIHVEVMRRRGESGAGTSGGISTMVLKGREMVVNAGTPGETVYGIDSVSRTKIPLPAPGMKVSGMYGLVKSQGPAIIPQGHISVTVELEKITKFY